MQFSSLKDATKSPAVTRASGPVAVIIAEDSAEVESTVSHHAQIGFKTLIIAAPEGLDVPDGPGRIRITHPTRSENATTDIVNRVADALPANTWLYYCYNAEYLFYPYAETRTIGEMLAFHCEERRGAMLAYVIDLYNDDLAGSPIAISRDQAMLDKTGYYALTRTTDEGVPEERQLDFFGGLKWRFEEHIPEHRRRIDRIAIVRTERGLTMRDDHTWSDNERNTYACPWHNNLTASIMSFRTAKALATNPSSRDAIQTFTWHNSTQFDWSSQQLMDLGLMEPGQWF